MSANQIIAAWFISKWRKRLEESGDVQAVARQLRKAGVPIEVARFVLLSREVRA